MPSLKSPISRYLASMQRTHVHPHHNVAAASTAPAALKAVLFVNLTSTGYIHSMYFAQPKYHTISKQTACKYARGTDSSMQTSAQGISPHTVQSPLSRPIPAAAGLLPTPFARPIPLPSPNRCCLSRKARNRLRLDHWMIRERHLGGCRNLK
jgi:hypothetical protein